MQGSQKLIDSDQVQLSTDQLQAIAQVQGLAIENLVQTALLTTDPREIQEVEPLLVGRLNNLGILTNLGLYLHQHRVNVQVGGETITVEKCLNLAQNLASEHPLTAHLARQLSG